MQKKRLSVYLTAGLAAAATLAAVPTATAEFIDPINGALPSVPGWGPPISIASDSSVVPLVVMNATGATQTMSVTIPPELTEAVQLYQPNEEITFGCGGNYKPDDNPYFSSGYTANFTVGPGQTVVYTLCVGGDGDYRKGVDNSFAIGGLPNGTSNASWYDFKANFNADDVLESLQPYYSNTGGFGTNNGQNGFNIMTCSPSGPVTNGNNVINVVRPVASPYSSGTYYPQNYGFGAPVCMGWAPQGTPIPTDDFTISYLNEETPDAIGRPVSEIVAAQEGWNGMNTWNLAFTNTTDVTGVYFNGVALPSSATSGGWWATLDNGDVVVEDLPAYPDISLIVQGANGTQATVTPPGYITAGQPLAPGYSPPPTEPITFSLSSQEAIWDFGAAQSLTVRSVKNGKINATLSVTMPADQPAQDNYLWPPGANFYLHSVTLPNGQTKTFTNPKALAQGEKYTRKLSIPIKSIVDNGSQQQIGFSLNFIAGSTYQNAVQNATVPPYPYTGSVELGYYIVIDPALFATWFSGSVSCDGDCVDPGATLNYVNGRTANVTLSANFTNVASADANDPGNWYLVGMTLPDGTTKQYSTVIGSAEGVYPAEITVNIPFIARKGGLIKGTYGGSLQFAAGQTLEQALSSDYLGLANFSYTATINPTIN